MTTIELDRRVDRVPPLTPSTSRAPTTPAHRPARTLRFVEPVSQLVLVLLAALAYFGVRGLTEADVGTAVAHARDVLTFEHHFGLDVESSLQGRVVGHHWIVTAVNWIYIWGHWPAIAGVLVWLHRSRRDSYRLMRNAIFVSGAIGLVIFAAFPVAPPRLAGFGLVDTVTEHSNSYRVLQPPALVNKYAAVPSLHVGWNFLVGVFLWRNGRRRSVRALGVASPVLMFTAVVLTANHYVVDGLLGVAVAATGLALASRGLPSLRRSRPGTPARLALVGR